MRNLSIDLVKVVAMFMVMTLHVPIAVKPDLLLSAGGYLSGIAVPLFFMVSGYLLIEKRVDWKYSTKKIFGIVRFVFLVVVIYWLTSSLIIHSFDVSRLIIELKKPFLQQGLFSVFWYFGAMIIIYSILPLINWIIHKFPSKGIFILLGAFFIIESFIFPLNLLNNFEENNIIQTFRVWNWIYYFLWGGVLKRLLLTLKERMSFMIPFIIGLVYITFGHIVLPTLHAVEYIFASPLCTIYAIVTFYFLFKASIKNCTERNIIVFLSKLFLPVYALHIVFITSVLTSIPSGVFGSLRPVIFLIMTWVGTISISWILMKIPFLNKIFKI